MRRQLQFKSLHISILRSRVHYMRAHFTAHGCSNRRTTRSGCRLRLFGARRLTNLLVANVAAGVGSGYGDLAHEVYMVSSSDSFLLEP